MAEKYTYADIITAIDILTGKVKKEDIIGKKGWFLDCIPSDMSLNVIARLGLNSSLYDIDLDKEHPFSFGAEDTYIYFLPEKEPEKKWQPFDLSKEEDRARLRGAWVRFKNDQAYECQVFAIDKERIYIWSNFDYFTPEGLLRDCTFLDGGPCGRLVEEDE